MTDLSKLGKADPYTGETAKLASVAPEQFEPRTHYERPLERNVVLGPGLASACQCPKCGELFAFYVPMDKGAIMLHLPDDEHPLCPRCQFSDKTTPPDAAVAMQECRWRYDAYKEATTSGSGFSNKEVRERFLKSKDAFWRYGSVLLRALEELFGNQVTRAVHEIETGESDG